MVCQNFRFLQFDLKLEKKKLNLQGVVSIFGQKNLHDSKKIQANLDVRIEKHQIESFYQIKIATDKYSSNFIKVFLHWQCS